MVGKHQLERQDDYESSYEKATSDGDYKVYEKITTFRFGDKTKGGFGKDDKSSRG